MFFTIATYTFKPSPSDYCKARMICEYKALPANDKVRRYDAANGAILNLRLTASGYRQIAQH